jgi:hypothetical protein
MSRAILLLYDVGFRISVDKHPTFPGIGAFFDLSPVLWLTPQPFQWIRPPNIGIGDLSLDNVSRASDMVQQI